MRRAVTTAGSTHGRAPAWLVVGAPVTWMQTGGSTSHGKPNPRYPRAAVVLAVTARSVKLTVPDRWTGNASWVRRSNVEPPK